MWTPDSRRLTFGWSNTGIANLYWQAADGSSPMERLATSQYVQWPGSWSPDGEILASVESHPGSGWDIVLLSVRDRKVNPFLSSRFDETYPEFSPDGRWISYVSNESGRNEVYVQSFPGPGGKWQISNESLSKTLSPERFMHDGPDYFEGGARSVGRQQSERWIYQVLLSASFRA